MHLLNIYGTSFYGSCLWDLYSQEVDRIYKSWNVTVRNVFDLPWSTHRYFIENVSGCAHPKTQLSSRYVKFVGSLTSSEKTSVRYLRVSHSPLFVIFQFRKYLIKLPWKMCE